jgi:DNA-binding CsgD family transcriptional regulator
MTASEADHVRTHGGSSREKTLLDLLGLDEVALAAYRLWLRDDGLTVDEIGAALGVPVTAVRRARDRLVELSLLLASTERPGQVVAVHPEAPLDHLLRDQHYQLIRQHELLLRTRSQLTSLVSDFQQGSGACGGGDEVERLDSPDATRARVFALLSTAEREVLTLHSRPGWQAGLTEDVPRAEIRALRRGVVMRKVLPRPAGMDSAAVGGYLGAVASYGLELRVTDDPGVDVTAVDGRLAVVRPADGTAVAPALLVRAEALTSLAVALFDQVWKFSEPLDDGEAGVGGEDTPTPQERTLLRLLSLGSKDEAAARHLGVSVRTVRRMVADLMRRLDARSRFQAGIVAAQRGWL